jgi:hypothetical protein
MFRLLTGAAAGRGGSPYRLVIAWIEPVVSDATDVETIGFLHLVIAS